MRTPDGRDEPFDTFERGGTRSGRFEATGLSGIYQVVPSSDPPTVFGVNAADDPLRSESDPERWTETELRDAFPDRSFHYQTQCCRSRALFGESAWEWPYALLWAVVLILLVEAILTRRAECMRL
jgi:hypothetical protein